MTPRVRAAAVALCGIMAMGIWSRPGSDGAGPALPIDVGPEDMGYRDLFTPSSSPSGTFAVYRSAEDIGTLAARLRALDPKPAAGAWEVERTGVFDAFGAEGPYDKGRLARLFGGSSPRAARGSLVTPQGRIAVALLSPYPDLALTSLQPGTLVIVTRLGVQRSGGTGFRHREGTESGEVRCHHREGTEFVEGFPFSVKGRHEFGEEFVLNHRSRSCR